jgi:hypothetical protein
MGAGRRKYSWRVRVLKNTGGWKVSHRQDYIPTVQANNKGEPDDRPPVRKKAASTPAGVATFFPERDLFAPHKFVMLAVACSHFQQVFRVHEVVIITTFSAYIYYPFRQVGGVYFI